MSHVIEAVKHLTEKPNPAQKIMNLMDKYVDMGRAEILEEPIRYKWKEGYLESINPQSVTRILYLANGFNGKKKTPKK